MTGDRNIDTGGGDYNENSQDSTGNSGTVVKNVGRDYAGRDVNHPGSGQKQDLAEAAAEIQKLLEQLEKSYPTDTTAGKMNMAAAAIEEIENNPTLMQRIFSAFKSGGVAAFEQFLNHPAASFTIAALEDWQSSNKD